MAKSKSKKSKKKKMRNESRIGFLLFAVVIFIVILISTVFKDCVQIYENKRETLELTEKYNRLLEESESLNSEVVKLQDPDYIARYAREKFLYTKDGEKILRIVPGNDKDKEDTSSK